MLFHVPSNRMSKTPNLSICNLIAKLDLTPKKQKNRLPRIHLCSYSFHFVSVVCWMWMSILIISVWILKMQIIQCFMFGDSSYHHHFIDHMCSFCFTNYSIIWKKKWILFPMPVEHNGSFICAFIHLIYPAEKKAFIFFLIQFLFSALTG